MGPDDFFAFSRFALTCAAVAIFEKFLSGGGKRKTPERGKRPLPACFREIYCYYQCLMRLQGFGGKLLIIKEKKGVTGVWAG